MQVFDRMNRRKAESSNRECLVRNMLTLIMMFTMMFAVLLR